MLLDETEQSVKNSFKHIDFTVVLFLTSVVKKKKNTVKHSAYYYGDVSNLIILKVATYPARKPN